MSEIKFRAWDKIKKKMVDLANMNFDPTGPLTHIILWDDDDNCYDLGVGSFKLMQYTGLKDKNGVEIYEGDVVMDFFMPSNNHSTAIAPRVGLVTWGIQGFKIDDIGPFEWGSLWVNANGNAEVIGNIHENPELLPTP